ncbi:MAG: hypothetical protein AB1467_03115 [Candidatus Diapherotrites archaeon]
MKMDKLVSELKKILTKEEQLAFNLHTEIFKKWVKSPPLFWKETGIDRITYNKIKKRLLNRITQKKGLKGILTGEVNFIVNDFIERIIKREAFRRAKFLAPAEKKELYKLEVLHSRMGKKVFQKEISEGEYNKWLEELNEKTKKIVGEEKFEKLGQLMALILEEIEEMGGGN